MQAKPPSHEVYPHQIAFNALPQCDSFEGDETTEETKLVNETHKILADGSIAISATCVRVPVWRSHSEAVWIETEREISADEARSCSRQAPGLRVVDDPASASYPMPSEAAGGDDVLVGRIRRDRSRRNGLALWVVADNLRKGAALNGVQIAEALAERRPDPCPRAGGRRVRGHRDGHCARSASAPPAAAAVPSTAPGSPTRC